MSHFDCWASRFGETTTALELAPEGTGYRARTRFAKFFNLPELMTLFKEVADIKTADQLDLPTPKVEYHNFVSKPTEIQQEMVKNLSERATVVHKGKVDPSHQSGWNYLTHSWGNGIVDDTWFTKLNYICFRDLSIAYALPEKAARAIKAQGVNLQANAHNLGYILNTMPNKENPESVRGTRASEFRVRNLLGVTTYYTFTVNVRF